MGAADLLTPAPATAPSTAVAAVPDEGFDRAAWVRRGRVHEERVRLRFLIWVPVLGIGAAISFARSRA